MIGLELALIPKLFNFDQMTYQLCSIWRISPRISLQTHRSHLFEQRGLATNVDRSPTAYWLCDWRDFVFGNHRWDLKSLYLHEILNNCRYKKVNRWSPTSHQMINGQVEMRVMFQLCLLVPAISLYFLTRNYRDKSRTVRRIFGHTLCALSKYLLPFRVPRP